MKEYAPNYYKDFSCLGSECPDNCCHTWRITLDKKKNDQYLNSENEDIKKISRKYIRKTENTNDPYFSYISMNDGGFCPFLNKNKLCSLQVEHGKEMLSFTCDTFPRTSRHFPKDIRLSSLDLSCPEAARLCLMDKSSMNFNKSQKNSKDKFFEFFPNEDRYKYSKVGENIFNFCFLLLKNKKIKVEDSLIIINKLIDQKSYLYQNNHFIKNYLEQLKNEFIDKKIINFDTSYFKIQFLDDFYKFIKSREKNLNGYKTFNSLFYDAYHELIVRHENIDKALKHISFIYKTKFIPYFNSNNFIYRNFYLNELIENALMFTNPTTYNENSFYVSKFTIILMNILILADLSKSRNNKIDLNKIVNFVYNIKRKHSLYSRYSSQMQKILNVEIIKILRKVDPSSTFNSLFILSN